jgi:hypothetical protein
MLSNNFSLDPCVSLAREDPNQLSLRHFDLLVFVEPNQEANVGQTVESFLNEADWKCVLDGLDNELGWNVECEADENKNLETKPINKVTISPMTRIIWIKNEMEDANYFENCISISLSDAIFPYKIGSKELPAFLIIFAHDLKYQFPGMKVAIIGGIFKNEVFRVANLFQQSGLETTILTRYCFSEQGFVN